MNLTIDLSLVCNIADILRQFQCINSNIRNINITIKFPRFIHPEYLITLVGIIKYISIYSEVNVQVLDLYNSTYPKRINFYKELGLDIKENFSRHASEGRFVEITNFNSVNSYTVVNDIMNVIRNNCWVDSSVFQCLNYCMWEMIDNVQVHANSPIGGYTIAQNFPQNKELKIVILDTGTGIHQSLTEGSNTQYRCLTPAQALEYCIMERVTNGKGGGYGLYHTTRFIQENQGTFEIYSGQHCLRVDNSGIRVTDSPYWQGTLIYVKINTHIPVLHYNIFGSNVPTSVTEANEQLDNLW